MILRQEGRDREAAAAVAHLEAEFYREFQARGALWLPDPPPGEPVEELLRQARARLAEQQHSRGLRPGQH